MLPAIPSLGWVIRKKGLHRRRSWLSVSSIPPPSPGYLEPQNATALYAANGQLTIWCSTQGSFATRQRGSRHPADPPGPHPGGALKWVGIRGKNERLPRCGSSPALEEERHKPLKMVMSHREVLAATGPTSASCIRVKMGVDRSGRITAASAYLAYAAGAFPGARFGERLRSFSPLTTSKTCRWMPMMWWSTCRRQVLTAPRRSECQFRRRDGGR